MAKIGLNSLGAALAKNNDFMKAYVVSYINNFAPTAVNVAKIMGHMGNTSIHITDDERVYWNSILGVSKQYANSLLANTAGGVEVIMVVVLPDPVTDLSTIKTNAIYLILDPSNTSSTVYNEYMFIDNEWVLIGSTDINMDNFYTKTQIDAMVNEIKSTATHAHANLDILSLITAPFTLELKTKLDGLPEDIDTAFIDDHINNANIHVSSIDRQKIDNIPDMTGVYDHIANNNIHVTITDKTRWDTVLADAKKYTDDSISGVSGGTSILIVSVLPDATAGVANTMYLVPSTSSSQDNVYEEYLLISGNWEHIGSSKVDLTDYVTKTDLQNAVNGINVHTHNNMAVLVATTAPFTTELNDILALLTVQKVNDLNSHVGDATTHVSSVDRTNWDGLETKLKNYTDDTISPLFTIVASLPTDIESINKNTTYCVPMSTTPITDTLTIGIRYNKYMFIENNWEYLGMSTATVDDGSGFYTKNQVDTLISGVSGGGTAYLETDIITAVNSIW
jgi:hypothetical protein